MKSRLIPIPNTIKGLIFDLDGTIIDSMPLHHKAYNHALARYGVHYPMNLFLSRGGIPTRDTLKTIAQENSIQYFNIDLALEEKHLFLEKHINQLTLIEPILDIIKQYCDKLPMAVGTGSNRKTVNEMFALFSLDTYFSHVVTATDVVKFKPHPETFLKCAQLIGIQPKDCLVFEDGKPGIAAAKAAGMQVVDIMEYL